MISWTRGPASALTRSAADVEQTITSTRRTRRDSAGPATRLVPTRVMFGRLALAIECSRLCAVSGSAEATPTRVPGGSWARAWRVSRCASASSAITGMPRPFRSRSTSGRWQKLVTATRQRPARAGRRATFASSPRSTRSARTGRWASSCPAKKSSSGGLHSTRRTSTVPWTAGGRTPARLRTPTARSSAVMPRAAARITVSCRKLSRRCGEGRAGGAGATNMPLPRRASTYPLCLRSSTTRATVLVLIPRKPASSRMLGSACSRGTPPLSMTCLSCSVNCRRMGMGLCASTARFIATFILYECHSTP